MDDQVAVGMGDSGKHIKKKSDTLVDIEVVAHTILIYAHTANVFEDQIGLIARHATPASTVGDMWVLHFARTLPSRTKRRAAG